MKSIHKILILSFWLLAAVCAVSCTKVSPDDVADNVLDAVIGEWYLAEELCEGQPVKDDAEVYLCIYADGTFELYQKSGTQMRYFKYEGVCHSEGNKLVGTYSDNTPWGAEYLVSFDGDRMVLTSYDKLSVQKYEKKSLSAEEKQNADLALKSNAAGIAPKL